MKGKKATGMSKDDMLRRLRLLIKHGDYLGKMDPSFSDETYAPQPTDEESRLLDEIDDATWGADEPEDIDKIIEKGEKSSKSPDVLH